MSIFTLEKAKKLGRDWEVGEGIEAELVCDIVQETGVEAIVCERLLQYLGNDKATIHSLAHLFVEGIILGYKFRQKELEIEELEKMR